MDNIYFSIIIPVYNAAKTIEDCVHSFINQVDEHYEIILVDDGSRDDSGSICDRLQKENDAVVAIHQANQGSLIARMTGASAASGQYLMFADADDIILDGAIERICRDIATGCDLYIYDYMMENVGGDSANTVRLMPYSEPRTFDAESKVEVSRAFMKGMMNTVCATAISRQCYDKVRNLQFPCGIKNGEDRLLKLLLLVAADSITYIPYAFYYYKWVGGSQGSNLRQGVFSQKIYDDFKTVWTIERNIYAKLGFSESEAIIYDGQKLNRVCGLLEKSFYNTDNPAQFDALIRYVASDGLFRELSDRSVRSQERIHIKITVCLLRGGHISLLKLYWRFCRCIRNTVYRKHWHQR